LTKRNVADLDSAFSNVPPLTSSIIVYRGIKPNLTGEEYFSDTAFISTTKVKRLALEFSDRECCILQITVSAGSRVLPIERLSYASNEQEILFDRNGELIMTGSSIDNHNMKILYVTYLPKNSLDEKSLDVSSIHGSDVRPVENDWNDTAEKSRDENISPSEIEKSLDF